VNPLYILKLIIYRKRIYLRITVTVGPLFIRSPIYRRRIQFAHYRYRCWSPLLLERLIYRTEVAFSLRIIVTVIEVPFY
jgi:hypothetical protein